jgi:hypothetical protein
MENSNFFIHYIPIFKKPLENSKLALAQALGKNLLDQIVGMV